MKSESGSTLPSKLNLADRHRTALEEESSISTDVVGERGYRTVTTKADLARLGFGRNQQNTPALLIPIWGVTGEIVGYQTRPDVPRARNGKIIKYEFPSGSHMALDVPPRVRSLLGDPSQPLFVTEGSKKADSAVSRGLCCIALIGVWNWRGTNGHGGKTALADWEDVALNEREVHIVFDSDVMLKGPVYQAMERLYGFLKRRGARVRLVYLPCGGGASKVGLDDFFAGGGTVEDLAQWTTSEIRKPPFDEPIREHPYEATEAGLVWLRPTHDGSAPTPVSNFTAKVVSEIERDDGLERQLYFEIEASLRDRVERIAIPAHRFTSMAWVPELLGAGAVIYTAYGSERHVRTAIQLLSATPIPRRKVHTHTGWLTIDDVWLYLHAGGVIGDEAAAEGIQVQLPEALHRFKLPQPPSDDQLRDCVRASLHILEVAPLRISGALLAAATRSCLGPADFSVFLAGPTGVFKSELAALPQQHFGRHLDARNLPEAWSSTDNRLESTAFHVKDALMVIDDFAPGGTRHDVARENRKADRVLRGQGNASGRGRCRTDGSLLPARRSRGLILATGEDVPKGQSLRSRMWIVDVRPGEVSVEALTQAQASAAAGLYAGALSGFVRWLASRMPDVQASLRSPTGVETGATSHRRTPRILGQLLEGLDWFLRFASACGALAADDADRLYAGVRDAMLAAAEEQDRHVESAEPTTRYLELLSAALASGEAHVADIQGERPPGPAAWGWRRGDASGPWIPQGKRVAWTDAGDLFLEPAAAYRAAQAMGESCGDGLVISQRTLTQRLAEKGLLVTTQDGRHVVQRTLGGRRRRVLHLRAGALSPAPEPVQAVQDGATLFSSSACGGAADGAAPSETVPAVVQSASNGEAAPLREPQDSMAHAATDSRMDLREGLIGETCDSAGVGIEVAP